MRLLTDADLAEAVVPDRPKRTAFAMGVKNAATESMAPLVRALNVWRTAETWEERERAWTEAVRELLDWRDASIEARRERS